MAKGIHFGDTLVNRGVNLNHLSAFEAFRLNHNVTYFKGETNFAPEVNLAWYQNNFDKTYYVVALYVATIFWGKHMMKTREKFDLRGALVLWNFGLALFSIVGTIRVLPNFLHLFMDHQHGFYSTVCTTGFMENKVLGYWAYLFGFSKVVELGDTAFIILRKQPLIFLHWYHHMTVLVFSWYTGSTCSSVSRWYTTMNLFVHSLMYSYYGFKALRFKIPKPIAQFVTSLQLIQMLLGITVTVAAYFYKRTGSGCETEYSQVVFSLAIYFSYWVLFANFFYQTYVVKRNPKENGVKKID